MTNFDSTMKTVFSDKITVGAAVNDDIPITTRTAIADKMHMVNDKKITVKNMMPQDFEIYDEEEETRCKPLQKTQIKNIDDIPIKRQSLNASI